MATVHNPNNWHWVEKNCVPWAKEYFDENLYKVSVPSGEYKISVKSINSVSGDCDVTQRKGKVKCLFELKVEFVVIVINSEQEEEEVTIVLPEFEHDYDESDFNFEVRTSKLPCKTAVRKQFLPLAVKEVFLKFQPDLIATHEVGMKHNTD
ncbi:hypothetical protein PICMEDRAFT_14706 [Pichia membranifaciens NRRL Y-2026]|uniref:Activator of Hsp90 ATPase AHSA1-like N-terminal domain-containing protein n=1 Tax=Pichia membranifaciens NRRL Y-2026 TaxID=763406 RepID=A0A1E3NT52_9ASCO|nr:hypothetical protein PICMEDRAFT_14706 [Pichia membranifaciens NRRL Y-2026]ODQ49240.1 hypothetical protein PICMEDRAFT_14706 [Pichia membranifaciens NRRL Y-2026]